MNRYTDILHAYEQVKFPEPRMSMLDRAAQFSPFAALTGFEEETKETERETLTRVCLDESEKEQIERTLEMAMKEKLRVELTYFIPDARKDGGEYASLTDSIAKYDALEKQLLLGSGTRIPLEELVRVEIYDKINL